MSPWGTGMTAWALLLPAALMGTERSPHWQAAALGAAQAGGGDDALQALLAAVLQPDAAGAAAVPASQVLLRAAGVLAVGERVGSVGLPSPGASEPIPPPAAADTRPALHEPRWLALLQHAWQDMPARLVHEAVTLLARRGWRLPARLLPLALARATREAALRAPLTAVLGERGHWLAAQHPQWQAVVRAPAAPTLEHWEHGSLEARAAFLRHERGQDGTAARERLARELPQQGARERSELVATLVVGLSPDDEPLLEGLRAGDRSREVRQQAVALLARLPGSAHSAWLAAQIDALLSPGVPGGRWGIEPPEREDPAWKDHAIDPVRPKQEALGERAWWLYQLVRQVPPAWWCERLQLTPAAVLQGALGTPWAVALLRGWRDALLAAAPGPHTHAWAEALLGAWSPEALGPHSAAVQALLPLPLRERQWQARLPTAVDIAWDPAGLLHEIAAACVPGEALSADLGGRLAQRLRAMVSSQGLAALYPLQREVLLDVCALLPLASLALLADLPRPDPATPSHLETLAQIGRLVAVRQALPDLPAAPNPL